MGKRFTPLALALAIICAVWTPLQAAEAPDGPVVLTISGKITAANRGKFVPEIDGLLKSFEVKFDKAMAFDRAMLAALPQGEITIQGEGFNAPVKLKGPRFDALLKAIGAKGTSISFQALDGYNISLEMEEFGKHTWVLGLEADGRPLGLGDKGPIWLAYDTGGKKVPEDEVAKWPWALVYMEVE